METTVLPNVRWALVGQSWTCSHMHFSMDATDASHERLVKLCRQLAELNPRGRQTAPGSPEREAVLEQWAPVHAAVLALAEELEGEESRE